MPSSLYIGLSAAFAALAVGIYHAAFVAPRLQRLGALLGSAGAPPDAVEAFRALYSSAAKRTEEKLEELERVVQRDVHRVGFVRYNSFKDVGSDLSFTLALLTSGGDGVVITSIYSREETRTYGKAVRAFVTQQEASTEEVQAIAMARNRG
jgi:hypothetical protein